MIFLLWALLGTPFAQSGDNSSDEMRNCVKRSMEFLNFKNIKIDPVQYQKFAEEIKDNPTTFDKTRLNDPNYLVGALFAGVNIKGNLLENSKLLEDLITANPKSKNRIVRALYSSDWGKGVTDAEKLATGLVAAANTPAGMMGSFADLLIAPGYKKFYLKLFQEEALKHSLPDALKSLGLAPESRTNPRLQKLAQFSAHVRLQSIRLMQKIFTGSNPNPDELKALVNDYDSGGIEAVIEKLKSRYGKFQYRAEQAKIVGNWLTAVSLVSWIAYEYKDYRIATAADPLKDEDSAENKNGVKNGGNLGLTDRKKIKDKAKEDFKKFYGKNPDSTIDMQWIMDLDSDLDQYSQPDIK